MGTRWSRVMDTHLHRSVDPKLHRTDVEWHNQLPTSMVFVNFQVGLFWAECTLLLCGPKLHILSFSSAPFEAMYSSRMHGGSILCTIVSKWRTEIVIRSYTGWMIVMRCICAKTSHNLGLMFLLDWVWRAWVLTRWQKKKLQSLSKHWTFHHNDPVVVNDKFIHKGTVEDKLKL